MGRPTQEQLQIALSKAAEMRENGNDPDFIAKSLLNLNWRVDKLEHLMIAIKHYLHSGHAAIEHRKLLKAIADAEAVGRVSDTEDSDFGLE